VRFLGQQFDFPPIEELVQGGEGILGDGTFIRVTPHLQTHQSHPDVQGPVELLIRRESVWIERLGDVSGLGDKILTVLQ